MRKFILRHKIILIAVLIAFIFVFLFIPFIFTDYPGGEHYPCPESNVQEFTYLCGDLATPETLYGYLQFHDPISSINWNSPLIAFFIAFVVIYGEIKLILQVIKFKNKKSRFLNIIWKIVSIVVLLSILFFFISLILNFYGVKLIL